MTALWKSRALSALCLLGLLVLPAIPAAADTGPKPTMAFTFAPDGTDGTLTVTSGELFECDQADCGDAEPLPRLGPQGLRCQATSCDATAYGFSPYHRLEVRFSDGKTRNSNVFATGDFESQYQVTVRPDDLLVGPLTGQAALPTTTRVLLIGGGALLLVLIVAGVILVVRRARKT
jgi:hypothetical protein